MAIARVFDAISQKSNHFYALRVTQSTSYYSRFATCQGRTWFEAVRLPTVVKPLDWVELLGTTCASELAFAGNLGSVRSYL